METNTIKEKNPYKYIILKCLRKARRPLTINYIAKRTKMTCPTAKKYIVQLAKENKIKMKKERKRTKWEISSFDSGFKSKKSSSIEIDPKIFEFKGKKSIGISNSDFWGLQKKKASKKKGTIAILLRFLGKGPLRFKELKKVVSREGTLSTRLRELEELTLIEAIPIKDGKRRFFAYHLTEKGEQIAKKLKSIK